jgi:hypothetical protein
MRKRNIAVLTLTIAVFGGMMQSVQAFCFLTPKPDEPTCYHYTTPKSGYYGETTVPLCSHCRTGLDPYICEEKLQMVPYTTPPVTATVDVYKTYYTDLTCTNPDPDPIEPTHKVGTAPWYTADDSSVMCDPPPYYPTMP